MSSSPMHRQYMEYTRGVDVTGQFHKSYSSQLQRHKWWFKIFHLIIDQTMVNAYVTWVREMEAVGLPSSTHFAFKIAVGRYLCQDAINSRVRRYHRDPPTKGPLPVHTLRRSKLKCRCVICGRLQNWFCIVCRNIWMCPQDCYQARHETM